MKKILFFFVCSIGLFFSPYLTAQTPYEGMPQFIPQNINDFDGTNTPWVRLHHGTFTNYERTLGRANGSDVSHTIISARSDDSLACVDSLPDLYLKTMPNVSMIPDWDIIEDGPLRVMMLGDGVASSNTNSSRISYYFKPDSNKSVLIVYFSFVAESPRHGYSDNPLFHIEVLQGNGQPITTLNPKYAYFLVNPQGANPSPNPDAQNMNFYKCSATGSGLGNSPRDWYDWIPVAFDLRDYIGQEIRLRITTRDCTYDYHFAYGYFTAKGASGNARASFIENDQISLSVPAAFASYQWWMGDSLLPDTLYQINRNQNTHEHYYKCVAISHTGAAISFDAYINYYDLSPDFDTEISDNNVQFQNLSAVTLINNDTPINQSVRYCEWDFGDGSAISTEVNPTHRYATIGTYTVTLKLFDNDKRMDSILQKTVTIETVSIPKTMQKPAISVFPNPTKDQIHIRFSEGSDAAWAQITDITGKVLISQKINTETENAINIRSLSKGLYFLQIRDEEGTISNHKILKQ